MNVLLTGFEPFGGNMVNPSQEVVRWFEKHGCDRSDVSLHTLTLPVAHAYAPPRIIEAIEEHNPDVIIMMGEAKGRAVLSIERIAINLVDYSMPDNKGEQIADEPVVHGGPAGFFTTLPVRESVDAVRKLGIGAEISQDAGTCLCNETMYAVLHHLVRMKRDTTRAGFVHLPWLPEQVAFAQSAADRPRPLPSMSLEHMVRGIQTILNIAIDALPAPTLLADEANSS